MRQSLIAIVLVVLVGCDSRPAMRAEFGDGKARILCDEATGQRYAVRHYFGDSYELAFIPKSQRNNGGC